MSITGARGFIRGHRRVRSGRLILLPPRRRGALLRGTALSGGSLAAFGAMLAKPKWRSHWLSKSSAVAAGVLSGLVFLPPTGAVAAPPPVCSSSSNTWNCTTTNTNDTGQHPSATIVPAGGSAFTVNIGVGNTPDKYTMTGVFSDTNSGALVIDNSNSESGIITETQGSTLTANHGDALRFYDTSTTASPTIQFFIYGKLYGGNNAAGVGGTPEVGDGLHIGQTGTHAPSTEASIGTLDVTLGRSTNTDPHTSVIRGADDALYIAQDVTAQVTITNYGVMNARGMNTSEGAPDGTNWGEGVHISRVDKGVGDTYQIAGAATLYNYGIILGNKNTNDSDANGPGSGVNISADGNIVIENQANANDTTGESGSITGSDGIVAYGGGTNDITVTNYGHVQGTDGDGSNLSHAANISVGNHSLGSMIGTTDGQDITDSDTAYYDNRSGLTAGLEESGLVIMNISGQDSDPPQYAVTVDNRSESGGSGGIIAGYNNGVAVAGVAYVSYVAGQNGVLINNSGVGSTESGEPGGVIVGTTIGNGIELTGVLAGDTRIDNSNTRNGATNDLSGSVIDSQVGYSADPPAGTSLFDALVSGSEGDYTYGLNYVLSGPGYPVAPGDTGISTGIWGSGSGIHEENIGGVAAVDNSDGQIFGEATHGIFLKEIGAATAQTGTVVDIDNTNNGLIEGGQSGVYLDTIYGDAWLHNGGGTTLGGDYGVDFNNVHGSAGIENWDGIIDGGSADGIALTTIGRNVGIWNGSDGPGGVIIGGESGIDASDVAGTFYLGNSDGDGEVLGLSEDGVSVDGLGGRGTEGGDALVVSNGQGLIAGYLDGIAVNNVYGNASEGDVNHVVLDNGVGLIVGLNGDGIAVTNVVSGESGGVSGGVEVWNTGTRDAVFDLADYGPAVFTSEGGGLLGIFGGESGLGSGGIFGGHDGVFANNIGGDISVANEDGLIVGGAGSGIDLATIGGNAFVYNGRLAGEGDGGLIVGGESGVSADGVGLTAYLDNGYGQVAGLGGDGVYINDVAGAGSLPSNAVGIDNGDGVIAGLNSGITIQNVTGNGSEGDANDVYVDNHASHYHQTDAGLIVGVDGDGVSVSGVHASESGGESGNVTINNRNTFDTSVNLTLLDPTLYDSSEGGSGLLYGFVGQGDEPGSESATAGIYGWTSGVSLADIGSASTSGGNATVENQNGVIVGTNEDGVSLTNVYGQAAVLNGLYRHNGDGGYIYGGESGIAGSGLGSAYITNNGGVIVGNEGDGVVLGAVGTGSNAVGAVVDIDNSSSRYGLGGVIVGANYGIDIEAIGASYSEGDNGVLVDNSGWDSDGHQHAGGLIVGVSNDAIHVANAEGDVAVDNRYTRGNGVLGLSGAEIGAAASGLVSPLSEAGDDFLAPATTGIWGLDGNGIYGATIAGSVSIDNRKGEIVGTKDSGGSGVYLTDVGSGVTDTGANNVVYVDNSSVGATGATEGDWASYSLITGGDYAVRLGNIHNGNVVFNNDFGIAYGDEMGFDLNGLTGGNVAITNAAGLIEGHDGTSFDDFPLRIYPADSYGAITIANVSANGGHGGSVLIENGLDNGTEGGAIVGISTASAIYIAGGVATAEIDNGEAWGTESDKQGGLIVGSGTTVNPVIVLDTSTGEGDRANGFVINAGIIASTNLYGFADPDAEGSTGNVAPVYADAQTIGEYVVAGGVADSISSGDFLTALGHMNNHNSGLRSRGTAATDVAVASDTGGADIANDGLLFGVVDLTGWNSDNESGAIGNSLTNQGVWFTQGTNTLTGGEGISSIRNDGLIQTAFGSESGETTTFNVTDFYNDRPTADLAYLSMLDGTVGDRNVINGNFHGSSDEDDGSYSYIAVDAYLDANGGAGKADTVTINGQVSGTTGIIVNVAPDSPGGLNTEGILVVQVNSSGDRGVCADPHCKDGDAFYISPASHNYISVGGVGAIQQGAFAWYLQDGDPAGQTNYDLVGDYMPTVYQTPALIAGATGIFFDAADVVSDHLFGGHFKDKGQGGGGADLTSDGSDTSTTNSALWGRASGSWSGQTASVMSGTGPTVDTSFNQNSYNLLAGADFSPNGEGTGMRYGLYGGYAESNLTFDTYNGSAKYEGGTVGGYAAYTNAGFYVDAQVNADFLNMTFNAPSIAPDFQASSHGTTVGVLADIGNRFSGGPYFIEPVASFAYADTMLGDVTSGAASVSFSNGQSLRAGVGARVGISETDPKGLTELSVLAKLWNEFDGNNTVTLSDGTPAGTDTVTISNGGVFGEVSGSATRFNTARTLSGFVSGGAQFKANATTWRANIGVRTAF